MRVFLLLAAMVAVAHAHGHAVNQASADEPLNNVRVKAARCAKFVPIKSSQASAAAPAGISIKGSGSVWQLLDKNLTCNPSSAVQVSGVFSQDGKPLKGFAFTSRTQTGLCRKGVASAANALSAKGLTNSTGAVVATGAPSSGAISLGSPNAPRSLVLFDDASNAPFACCDLVPLGPPQTNWVAQLAKAPGAKPCSAAVMTVGRHGGGHGGGGAHGRRLLM